MNVLLTAGPTREPIDSVRYIGNRSSGQMGAAIAEALLDKSHGVTLIVGPGVVVMPSGVRRIDVETSRQMRDAVMREFPSHALLIMAAAVADFRPVNPSATKLHRESGPLTLNLEPTEDILAAAGAIKRSDQRTIGFSLVDPSDIERSRAKVARKHVDLLVHNPTDTMNSPSVAATMLYPDGRTEQVPSRDKRAFADMLVARAEALFRA